MTFSFSSQNVLIELLKCCFCLPLHLQYLLLPALSGDFQGLLYQGTVCVWVIFFHFKFFIYQHLWLQHCSLKCSTLAASPSLLPGMRQNSDELIFLELCNLRSGKMLCVLVITGNDNLKYSISIRRMTAFNDSWHFLLTACGLGPVRGVMWESLAVSWLSVREECRCCVHTSRLPVLVYICLKIFKN